MALVFACPFIQHIPFWVDYDSHSKCGVEKMRYQVQDYREDIQKKHESIDFATFWDIG
jgi:hypothetical protein